VSVSRAEVERQVIRRAGERCEYCRMHQSLQGATFHIEHITPRAAGGSDELDNLGLACPSCNLSKSDRRTATDPDTGQDLPLFHPRTDRWADHFDWAGTELVGRTPTGRALVAAFALNSGRRRRIREAERMFDLFPP
jgi:hypothetical protein